MNNEQLNEYTSYIYGIMKKFKNYPNKEDLFQAGRLGLLKAYSRYNPDMGAKFTTYAYLDVIGEMYKLVNEDKPIKVSLDIKKLGLKIEKANILLSQKLYRYPTTHELATYLDVDEELIEYTLCANSKVSSLDDIIITDSKPLTLYDSISNNDLSLDTLISLKQEISNLDDNDRYILNMNLNNYTQEEIANELGINQVQVSRKLTKIKQRIKSNVA